MLEIIIERNVAKKKFPEVPDCLHYYLHNKLRLISQLKTGDPKKNHELKYFNLAINLMIDKYTNNGLERAKELADYYCNLFMIANYKQRK